MIRVYKPYWLWEDWLNGMWIRQSKINEEVMLKKASSFTGDHVEYGKAMREVVKSWPNTMLNSLTNVSINRRAFLGHCAVSYKIQCPEYITRMAWKLLTDDQRKLADLEATKTILQWEREHKERLMNTSINGNPGATKMGFQMKLQLK